MIILGIETSCDDTCISLIKVEKTKNKLPQIKIISNIVSSQIEIHEKWGGVYPSLAKREHQKNLPILFKKTFKKNSKIKPFNINAVAVTVGPGLDPCLWTGINFANEISESLKVPVIPVNHIEAHLIISFFSIEKKLLKPNKKLTFPAIGLIVSGGHTLIVLIKKMGDYKVLGETRDDAAGECFDKTARILGLNYPGGPAIATKAAEFSISLPAAMSASKQSKQSRQAITNQFSIKLPRPMIHSKNFDFSFSGLKTSVLYHHKETPLKIKRTEKYKIEMAKEIQESIVDVLIKKTISAASKYKTNSIILGGGVTANKRLKSRFKKESRDKKINVFFPPTKMQTDNALMIAVTGFFKKPVSDNKIKSLPNLKL